MADPVTAVAAATAAAPAFYVDLGPFVQQIIEPILIPVAGSLGSWILYKIVTLLHLNISASQQMMLNSGLDMAISYATNKVEGWVPGKIDVNVHNAAVAVAAQFALEHVPDALGALGISQAQLVAMIEAKLQSTPSSTPILPPAPAATATK